MTATDLQKKSAAPTTHFKKLQFETHINCGPIVRKPLGDIELKS